MRLPPVLALLVWPLLLAACFGGGGAPATVATPTPSGWTRHTGAGFEVVLPQSWYVVQVGQESLDDLFAGLVKENPEYAAAVGNPQALQGVSLFAFSSPSTGGPVDSLNIRRSAIAEGGQSDLRALADQIAARYKQLGFTVGSQETGLAIGGLPAARIAYSLPVTDRIGKQIQADAVQYLIATPQAFWVLTFTAVPGKIGASAPVFDQTVQSFRVK